MEVVYSMHIYMFVLLCPMRLYSCTREPVGRVDRSGGVRGLASHLTGSLYLPDGAINAVVRT